MEDLMVVGEEQPSLVTSLNSESWQSLSNNSYSIDPAVSDSEDGMAVDNTTETETDKYSEAPYAEDQSKSYMDEPTRDSYSEEIRINETQPIEELPEGFVVKRKRSKNRIKPIRIGSDPTSELVPENGEVSISPTKEVGGFKLWDFQTVQTKIQEISSTLEEHFLVEYNDLKKGAVLGKGGFSEVHLCYWFRNNQWKEIAVKQFNFDWDEMAPERRAKTVKYFQREVETLRKASNHPNIVKVLGVCAKLPNLCIVLEYMRIGSLSKILHKEKVRFDSKSILRIGLEVTKGMLHLHSMNIIHRDLHAGNVLLDATSVKLTDFGLSRTLPESGHSALTQGLYHLRYGAPELFRNEEYGKNADVYQFGVLIYELLTGKLFLGNKSDIHIGYAVSQGLRPDLPKDREELFPNFSDINLLISQTNFDLLINLIKTSWANDPSLRPNFSTIFSTLQQGLSM